MKKRQIWWLPFLAILLTVLSIISGTTHSWQLSSVHAATEGVWITDLTLNSIRPNSRAVVLNGTFYLVGGDSTSDIESYDQSTNRWTVLATLPSKHDRPAVGSIGGKIYVVGGYIPNTIQINSSMEIYNPGTNTWTSGKPMPIQLAGSAYGVINGKLYIAGGERDLDHYSTELQIYDPNSNTWSTGATMLAPTSEAASGVINGKLYVAGGGDSFVSMDQLQIYDPVTNSWKFGTHMNISRGFAAAGVVSNKLYVAGGLSSSQIIELSSMEVYDPVTNLWSLSDSLPLELGGATGEVIGNKFYVAGGHFGAIPVKAFLYYVPSDPPTPTATSTPVSSTPTMTATPSNTPIIPTATPEIVTLSGNVGLPEVFPKPSVSSYSISAVDAAGKRYTATTDQNSNYTLRVRKGENYKITIAQPNGYIVRFAEPIGGNDFVFYTTVEALADQNKVLPSAIVGPCVSPFTGLDICSLKKGDIILLDRSSTGNDLLSNSFGSYWLHTALVGDDTNIIEAQSTSDNTTDVIVHFPLFTTSYLDQNTNNFVVLRVKEKYQSYIDAAVLKAVQWASDPTVSYVKNPLDILQDTSLKQQRKQFYCSMFVWAAYFDASGGTLDLDSDKGIMREQTILNSLWLDLARKQIFPDDLFATTIIGGKTYDGRDYAATTDMVVAKQIDAEMIKTILFSPMDILLTDAQGRRVGYDRVLHKIVNEIPGAYYTGPDSEPETINFKSSGAAPYKITLTGTDTGDAVFGFQTMTIMGTVKSAAVQLTGVVTGTTYTFTANQSNGTPELTLGEPGAVIYPLYLPLIKK